MGNVKTLKRKKDNVLIDNLTLEYNGNQLKYINDPQGSQNLSTVKEYQNKSNTTAEFTYDVNGNLTKDLDRDIVTIRYNLLNLPDTVQFKNGNQIINKYDAGGQKLSVDYLTLNTPLAIPLAEGQVNKWTYNSSLMTVTGTVYDGTYEYNSAINSSGAKSFTLNKVYNPEGYIRTTDNAYMYYRRDHLGNNREVWLAQANANIQRTQYYPSGLPWAESTGASIQNRKYNGKEWIEAHGLDEYDSQARMYYPAIMRTTTMDPLAEKYYSISPYAWCGNNPVKYIDPTGMEFTESAWDYVNKLIAEVNSRQASNNAEIAERQAKLNGGGLSARQERRLNRQIGRLEGQNSQLETVRGEVATLAASDQVYDVKTSNSYSSSGSVPGTGTDVGAASFNFSNGNFEIIMPSSGGLNLFSHELKHAYQFETGAYSVGPELSGTYKNLFYDKHDELEGYNRGALFGGTTYSIGSLPSEYNSIATGPVDATTHPNISGILGMPIDVQKRALQNIANTTRHAFRINGTTYYKPR